VSTSVHRVVTIGRSPEELLDLWRRPEVQARAFAHVGGEVSTGDGPDAADGAAWSVEMSEAAAEELRWTSHTQELAHTGALVVRPAPNGFGTEVTLRVDADGDLPSALSSPALFEVLHRFKSLAETGEIPTLDRNPHARHSGPDPH
jgi:hypothetical protein